MARADELLNESDVVVGEKFYHKVKLGDRMVNADGTPVVASASEKIKVTLNNKIATLRKDGSVTVIGVNPDTNQFIDLFLTSEEWQEMVSKLK